jgi:hypothetical protein
MEAGGQNCFLFKENKSCLKRGESKKKQQGKAQI